jgi:murein DD-endopeptidase MepM/ murein hydrolase activator NlpD
MTLVTLGQLVRERQVIALSGSTGRSTGPHLHFEVLIDGEPVDPLTVVEQPT